MWELGTSPSLDLHSRLLLPDTHVLFHNLDLKSRRRTEQKARLEFSVCNLGHLRAPLSESDLCGTGGARKVDKVPESHLGGLTRAS